MTMVAEPVRPRRRVYVAGRRLAVVIFALFLAFFVAITAAYVTVPKQNNNDPQVDAILVLGTPTGRNGVITPAQQWRVDEAVREYKAGRAQNVIISGGPTSFGWVEARTMCNYARLRGIPASALHAEGTAMTTVENISRSQRILQANGWRRVEVISTADHLPRAALILQHSDLLWRVHAAPATGRSWVRSVGAYAEEAVGTAAIRWFGLGAEPVLHGFANVQHRIQLGIFAIGRKLGLTDR